MKSIMTLGILLLTFFAQARDNHWNYAFIENKGQIIDQNGDGNSFVKYLWCGSGYNVQLKRNCFSYDIINKKYNNSDSSNRKYNVKSIVPVSYDSIQVHRIDVNFIGANSNPTIITEGCSSEYLNFYNANVSQNGVTQVHYFSKVIYKDIYPNIDLEFICGTIFPFGFKYNFIVHAGGNFNNIAIQYNGSRSIKLTPDGNLILYSNFGIIEEKIPMSCDMETNRSISVSYKKLDDSTFSFKVNNYNRKHNLLIDPWATYYGWSGGVSQVNSITTDKNKNSIVIGQTNSLTNIASSGAHQVTFAGGTWDAFIRKFNPTGFPEWSTYYGGNESDKGFAISTSTLNGIVVVGETQSPNNISTPNSFQSTIPASGISSFIAVFDSNGIRQWATYYPTSLWSVVYDNQNNIIVAGITDGDTGIATIGAHQTIIGGDFDCVVTKFNSLGVRQWSTYYGGNNKETNDYLSVDNNDNIILSGITSSTNNISSVNAYQQFLGGSFDIFITKFSPTGIRQWGTYYGSSGNDEGIVCNAVDANGNIYVSGVGDDNSFFSTNGAFQTVPGFSHEFIAKFNPSGLREWGTYFGGNDEEFIYGMACDNTNNLIFIGQTKSTSVISSTNSYQTNNSGDFDAFIEKFSPNGLRLWGTYFGGSAIEIAVGVSVDNANNIYITGNTSSSTNIATSNSYQNTLIGSSDAFLACFDSTGHFTSNGINDFIQNRASLLQVYPNPTKDKIVVHLKGYTGKEGSLKLQTIEGKLLKQCSVKAEETSIDLKELAIGVYLLE